VESCVIEFTLKTISRTSTVTKIFVRIYHIHKILEETNLTDYLASGSFFSPLKSRIFILTLYIQLSGVVFVIHSSSVVIWNSFIFLFKY